MTEEEHKIYVEEMKKVIEQTITVVVNGKINSLDKKFTDYAHADMSWKQEKVEPLIEAHKTVINVANFIKWASIIIMAIVTPWIALKELILNK